MCVRYAGKRIILFMSISTAFSDVMLCRMGAICAGRLNCDRANGTKRKHFPDSH
jgi:hypothetical protein